MRNVGGIVLAALTALGLVANAVILYTRLSDRLLGRELGRKWANITLKEDTK